MYTKDNIQQGVEWLGITNCYEIFAIEEACRINLEERRKDGWGYSTPEQLMIAERWKSRFKIPHELDIKQLNKLLKETQEEINNLLEFIRKNRIEHSQLQDLERADYVEKKIQIKKKIEALKKFGARNKEEVGLNIAKAKQYPIENLLEFDSGGFTRCPYHNEKTGSMKWYPERNKVHCFGGCGDFDSIDVYQKLNNVSFNEAVKALTI